MGFIVNVLGTGSKNNYTNLYKPAGVGFLIIPYEGSKRESRIGRATTLFDIGTSTYDKLKNSAFRNLDIANVLLSHTHTDHISDLSHLIIDQGHHKELREEINVYAPLGESTTIESALRCYKSPRISIDVNFSEINIPNKSIKGRTYFCKEYEVKPGKETKRSIENLLIDKGENNIIKFDGQVAFSALDVPGEPDLNCLAYNMMEYSVKLDKSILREKGADVIGNTSWMESVKTEYLRKGITEFLVPMAQGEPEVISVEEAIRLNKTKISYVTDVNLKNGNRIGDRERIINFCKNSDFVIIEAHHIDRNKNYHLSVQDTVCILEGIYEDSVDHCSSLSKKKFVNPAVLIHLGKEQQHEMVIFNEVNRLCKKGNYKRNGTKITPILAEVGQTFFVDPI